MPNIGRRIHSQVDLINKDLRRDTKFSGLVEAFVDATGAIQYRSTFDGFTAEDLRTVWGHVSASKINTFKTFSPGQTTGREGLAQIADEIDVLNQRLSSLSSIQKRQLERLGLKDLIGKEINMIYAHFEYGNDLSELRKIRELDYVKNAGLLNITDKGVTVINYSVNGQLISGKQAKELNNALGLGKITENLSKSLARGETGKLGKVPKRQQALLAARDISLTGDHIANLLDESKGLYTFDEIGSFFKGMLDPNLLTEEERFVMAAGLGFKEKDIRLISEQLDTKKATAKKVKAAVGSRLDFQSRLRQDYQTLTGMSDAEMLRMQNLMKEAKDEFDSLTTAQRKTMDVNNFLDLFKQKVKNIRTSTLESDIAFSTSIQSTYDGLEKFRDGTGVLNVNALDHDIKRLQTQIESMKKGTQALTEQDMEEYRILKRELESLMYLRKNGQEGLDSAIARMAMPGRQGKNELFVRTFNWLPKGLRDKLLYLPQSSIKKEIQSQVSSLTLNVAKTHKEQVYSDPLMLLYHTDYFGDPNFTKGIEKNVQKQMESIQKFMDTGLLTEDIRENIIGTLNSQLDEEIPLSKMTAGARASYIRNRQEAKAIRELLQSGVDPRQIPALVRRITDYYTTMAFRIKTDSRGIERADFVMPGAARRSIKTYESVLDPATGTKQFESAKIDVSELGQEGKRIFKELGQSPELNFVQFRLKGQNMLVSGVNASLYHHALGTFDLDDKGLPIMTTFKGADGKDRFAFMTLRQPTGFQEKIFMQANLSDYDTLKQTMEFFGGDFQGLLNDSEATQKVAVTQKQKRILGLLQDVKNGKKSLDFKNVTSDDINKLLTELVSTGEALNNHGFTSMVRMSSENLLEMAVSGSASPLGLDKLIKVSAQGQTDLVQLRDILRRQGIDPTQAPGYTSGNFISIITKADDEIRGDLLVKSYNSLYGSKYKNIEELQDYIYSEKASPTQKSDRLIKMLTAQDQMLENLQLAANIDIADSLGLYINRQGVAASMTRQIDDILGQLGQVDLVDFYRAQFGVAVIPPSEAVDVAKALIGKSMVQAKEMEQIAVAIAGAQQTGDVSQQAIENAIKRIGKGELLTGQAGIEAVEQTGRGVGFLRAMQLAKGADEADLIGYDRALFEKKGAYARIKNEQDVQRTISSVIEGAQEAKRILTEKNATQEEIDRVQSLITEMKNLDNDAAMERLFLNTGSKYAVTSAFAKMSETQRALVEGIVSTASKVSRAARDPLQAVSKAEHIAAVDRIIEARKQDLESIQKIIKGSSEDAVLGHLKRIESGKVGTFLYDAVAAISEKNKETNILDIIDTLEARIVSQFDEATARVALTATIGVEGGEDEMVQLIEDARSRRAQSRALKASRVESYDALTQKAKSYGFQQLEDISKEIAKGFLKNRTEDINHLTELAEQGDDTAAGLLAKFNEADDVYDFMKLVAGEESVADQRLSEEQRVSKEAQDAYTRMQAQKEMDRLEETYGSNSASRKVLSPSTESDEAAQLIDEISAADDLIDVKRGSYKRFADSLKNGALKEVFQDKLIRNSTYAIAGLAAFGFIYSARKDKEFTQEQAAGPPLLPGGSAYETDMPKNLPSLSDLKYLNPVVAGMQYKINVMGSQKDMEKMQYLAGNVVGGPVDSTMYNSLPPLGRDPYSQVASRY